MCGYPVYADVTENLWILGMLTCMLPAGGHLCHVVRRLASSQRAFPGLRRHQGVPRGRLLETFTVHASRPGA